MATWENVPKNIWAFVRGSNTVKSWDAILEIHRTLIGTLDLKNGFEGLYPHEYTPEMEQTIANQWFTIRHEYDRNDSDWLKEHNKLRDHFTTKGLAFRTTHSWNTIKLWVKWSTGDASA